MNILRYYPPLGGLVGNVGDNLVEWGARTVLKERADTLCLVGTPWFWDLCEQSKKYRWLEEQINRPRARKKRLVAVGIGACLPLGRGLDLLCKPATIAACRRIWGRFEKIFVRDTLALDFLQEIGVWAERLPCPSVLCPLSNVTEPRPGSTLFIDAPAFHDDMRARRRRVTPPAVADHFLYQPGVFNEWDVERLLELFCSYETIVSCRLHALLPLATRAKVAICPLDSRAEAATWLGVPAWPDPPEQMDWDLDGWTLKYLEALA